MVTDQLLGDRVMDALGHRTRRDILALLKEAPMPVGDIAERLPVSRPAVSKHLRILESAGLVEYTSSGTRNIFRLSRGGFQAARAYLEGFWDEALANFHRVAEDEAARER
jgi:DNA-binding transcriptional ArsR family regulator